MLARFFKKSDPIGFISLLILLIVYILIQIFIKVFVVNSLKSFTLTIVVLLFFSFFVFFIDFIIKKNQLSPPNYYAIFIFVLLMGLFPSVLELSEVSYSYFFVLLALRRIYSIQTKKQLLLKLFDSGFYIGIAFLLYPPSGLFLFLVIASYSIYIHVVSKDILLTIIGFFTPIYILYIYFFLSDNLYAFKSITELNINFDYRFFTNSILYIPLFIVLFLSFTGMMKMFYNGHLLGVRWQNSHKLVVFHLLIGIVISLINSASINRNLLYLFFPIAILIGNMVFLSEKKWIKEFILFMLLTLTFILPFF